MIKKVFLFLTVVISVGFLFVFPVRAQDTVEGLTGQDIKNLTVSEVAGYYHLNVDDYINQIKTIGGVQNVTPDTNFQLLHDNFGFAPSMAMDIAEAMIAVNAGDASALSALRLESEAESTVEKEYNLPLISLTLISLYLVSVGMVKAKKISLIAQRKIWNIGMIVFFLSTAVLGIFLVLRLSHDIVVPLPFNMLFWHVEAGLAFSAIAVFHIIWHFPYFKAVFRKSIS